jgi:hypothetical protein
MQYKLRHSGFLLTATLQKGLWSSYWSSLLLASVEDVTSKRVDLLFSSTHPSLSADDFTVTINGSESAITNVFWEGNVLVLVLSDIVANGDEVVVVFERTGEEVSVINRVA